MVCFFLSLLKRKLPQSCPKRGGGVKATFGQCPKGSSFFLGLLPIVPFGNFHMIGGAPPKTFPNIKYDAPKEVGGNRKCLDSPIK